MTSSVIKLALVLSLAISGFSSAVATSIGSGRGRKLSKKKKSKQRVHHPGYCNKDLFTVITLPNLMSFVPGEVRQPNSRQCKNDNVSEGCVGDVVILQPVPIYSDIELRNQVGTYQSKQTVIEVSGDKYDTIGTYVVKFIVDGTKSELVFGGELDIQEFIEEQQSSSSFDLPISGGTGLYVGVSGSVDLYYADPNNPDLIGMTIRCL